MISMCSLTLTCGAWMWSFELCEIGRRKLVGTILKQAGEEQVAGLKERQVLLVLDIRGREQPSRLQIEQGRCHDEKLGGLPEIPLAGRRQMSEKLVGDLRQRHLGHVHLAAADQAEQQVEWTLEVVQPHVKAHRRVRA